MRILRGLTRTRSAPPRRAFLPAHSFHPAPPLLRNRALCLVFGHHLTMFAFNHYTLQADLLCLRCSRYIPFSLATLWPENLDEDRPHPNAHPAETVGDDALLEHAPPEPATSWWAPPDVSTEHAEQY